jgi:HEAT repeat protein
MEHVTPQDDRSRLLKHIEEIANRDLDAGDAAGQLLEFLKSADAEVALSALQATWNYVQSDALFLQVFQMAQNHGDEEVRGMANSCLGAIIRDGLEFEDDMPEGWHVTPSRLDVRFYQKTKTHLLERVDALMESMEVRRRCVEALGYLCYKPEIRDLVLRFYHQAPNPWVRVSALFAMGLHRDPVFERLVLEELHSTNENILLEAVHSAGSLELHAAKPRLIELALSHHAEIRYEAIVSLGMAGATEGLPEVFTRIEAQFADKETREAVALARKALEQRSQLVAGEPIWDDGLVLGEIEDMIADASGGNE